MSVDKYIIADSKESSCVLERSLLLAESKAVLGASAFSMALGTCTDGCATKVCVPRPVSSRAKRGWSVERRDPGFQHVGLAGTDMSGVKP